MSESLIVAIFLANSSAFYSLQKITSLIPTSLVATRGDTANPNIQA